MDAPATVDFSTRMLTRFNADGSITTSSETLTEYEDYVLPDEYSIFLVKYASEVDDLATRYNTLLAYTKGLLTVIEQYNHVKATSTLSTA